MLPTPFPAGQRSPDERQAHAAGAGQPLLDPAGRLPHREGFFLDAYLRGAITFEDMTRAFDRWKGAPAHAYTAHPLV